jgi:hypothetical protein
MSDLLANPKFHTYFPVSFDTAALQKCVNLEDKVFAQLTYNRVKLLSDVRHILFSLYLLLLGIHLLRIL